MGIAVRHSLTERQSDCYNALETYIRREGRSPSFQELATAMGYRSRTRIKIVLESMQARGWITFRPYAQRSIAIVAGAVGGVPAYTLPPKTEAALRAHCAANGEDAAAFVADAVALLLDQAELDGTA